MFRAPLPLRVTLFCPSSLFFFSSPSFLGTAIVCCLPLDGLSAGSSLSFSPRSRTGYFETEDQKVSKGITSISGWKRGNTDEEKI